MQPPTGNQITQRRHGPFNAVDYAWSPDWYVYAPERMTFYAYIPNAGDAGNNLQMDGAHGRHGFCHLEEIYITGGTVEKGYRIAKMGYSGKCEPPGPEGRHLHWVIRRKDGTYVYPPDLVTEPFPGSKENNMYEGKTAKQWAELYKQEIDLRVNMGDIVNIKEWLGLPVNAGDDGFVGMHWKEAVTAILTGNEYKESQAAKSSGDPALRKIGEGLKEFLKG
jgi:hypothetical protein